MYAVMRKISAFSIPHFSVTTYAVRFQTTRKRIFYPTRLSWGRSCHHVINRGRKNLGARKEPRTRSTADADPVKVIRHGAGGVINHPRSHSVEPARSQQQASGDE